MAHKFISQKYGHGRFPMHSTEMLETLGVVGGKLPNEGMAPRLIQGVKVWVRPFMKRPRKSSSHRVLCECPDCGVVLSAGRLNQHVCKVVPVPTCPHGRELEWNDCPDCMRLVADRAPFKSAEAAVLVRAVAQLMAETPEGLALRKSLTGQGPRKYFEVREIALGETQRMATCATAGEAIVLAKEWHDTWGSRVVALDPEGEVIAEHAAGEPR